MLILLSPDSIKVSNKYLSVLFLSKYLFQMLNGKEMLFTTLFFSFFFPMNTKEGLLSAAIFNFQNFCNLLQCSFSEDVPWKSMSFLNGSYLEKDSSSSLRIQNYFFFSVEK